MKFNNTKEDYLKPCLCELEAGFGQVLCASDLTSSDVNTEDYGDVSDFVW